MIPKFLTREYPLDKHLFLIPRFTFGLLGCYPEAKMTIKELLWCHFNFAILCYCNYAGIHYGIHYLSIDIPTAMDALCPAATSIMSILKLFYIRWYRKEIKFLMERVHKLMAQQDSSNMERTKRSFLTFATRLNTSALILAFSCSTTYSLRSIVNNVVLYINGEDILYDTPFKMIFPEKLLSMPLYPLTFLLVHWYGYATILSFVGTAALFLDFSLYFSILLKALQEDLDNILSAVSDKKTNEYKSDKKVCIALENIIKRHNEIAELTNKFSTIMVEITLTQFITSSIIIAISVVEILLFSGLSILVYVAYTGTVFTEIFIYCLGGNMVMESSEELATKAYCSHWYTHSTRVQKMVLLIMIRSQRAITIKVPFFTPSLPALASILRFTGSVIALAKSVI